MTARAAVLAIAVLTPALAGCGSGGGGDDAATGARRQSAPREPPQDNRGTRPDTRRADPRAIRVIRAWVDAERAGNLDRAASYFDLPTLVLNGPQPLLLRTRAAARQWNADLPCGGVLVRAVAVRGYTVARFRLTERPGASCDGTGNTASTAFKLRRGRISQWIRVADYLPPHRALPAPGRELPSPAGQGTV